MKRKLERYIDDGEEERDRESNPKSGKYRCRSCLKFFKRAPNLAYHMRAMHNDY